MLGRLCVCVFVRLWRFAVRTECPFRFFWFRVTRKISPSEVGEGSVLFPSLVRFLLSLVFCVSSRPSSCVFRRAFELDRERVRQG